MPSLSKLSLARAISFIHVGTAGMFTIYEVTHMSNNGLSGSSIGILLAIQSGLILASGPLWGWFSDRFGWYRELLTASAFGLAFTLYWLSQASTLSDFVVYICLRGLLFTALTSTTTALAMSNLAAMPPGRGFSAYRIFGSIGFMVSSFALPIFFTEVPHILIAGACFLPFSTLFIWKLDNPPRRKAKGEDDAKMPIPAAAYLYLAAHFAICITDPGNIGFLNDYIRELGGSTKLMGWYAALTGLTAMIALPLMGRMVDSRGPYLVLSLAFISQIARPFIVSSISDPNWLWLSHLCHLFGWAGREVGALVLMLSFLGAERRATAVSIVATTSMAGAMVGAYLMGTWSEQYGYQTMFRNISLLALTSLPLLALSIRFKQKRIKPAEGRPTDR